MGTLLRTTTPGIILVGFGMESEKLKGYSLVDESSRNSSKVS